MRTVQNQNKMKTFHLDISWLFQAPEFPKSKNPDLVKATRKIGPLPKHPNKKMIPSASALFDQIAKSYGYREREEQIRKENPEWIATLSHNATVVVVGSGGREGGRKIAATLHDLPDHCAQLRPRGIVVIDIVPGNPDEAREGYLDFLVEKGLVSKDRREEEKKKIKTVTGDAFFVSTWYGPYGVEEGINEIKTIHEKPLDREGPPDGELVVVLIDGVSWNDYTRKQKRKLVNLVFNLTDPKNIRFCPTIDSTVNRKLLETSYVTPDGLIFGLWGAAEHCRQKGIPFDPIAAVSTIEIIPRKNGAMLVQHMVIDPRNKNRFVFHPIRKTPEKVIEREMKDLGLVVGQRLACKSDEVDGPNPTKLNCAVLVLKKKPREVTPR